MPSIFEIAGLTNPVTLHIQADEIVDFANPAEAFRVIKIDATVSEEHSLRSQTTNFEVEDGSLISDHIINQGVRLSLQAVISDDPITIEAAAVGLAAGIAGDQVGGVPGAAVTGVGALLGSELLRESKKPSKSAYDSLREAYDRKLAFTIITGLTTYTNMIMENLTIPRNVRNSRSLTFTIQFKKIGVAVVEIISVPIESVTEDAKGATDKENLGNQTTTAVTEEQNNSILRTLSDKSGFSEFLQ